MSLHILPEANLLQYFFQRDPLLAFAKQTKHPKHCTIGCTQTPIPRNAAQKGQGLFFAVMDTLFVPQLQLVAEIPNQAKINILDINKTSLFVGIKVDTDILKVLACPLCFISHYSAYSEL
jgi:hypothetical protein